MPDDNRTQDQSNDTLLDPPDDLIAPILRHDEPADSRRPTAPNALSNIVKADHDAFVTDEELLAEGRNEMLPSSASKAPTPWRRIWLAQLLVACLLLVATDVSKALGTAEFVMNEEDAQKAERQKALDSHLRQYEDDPLSTAIATIEFQEQEEESQRKADEEARKKERDDVMSQHDDPVMQAWALATHDLEKTKNLPQKRAFADLELLEKIKRIDKLSRKLERITPNNALIREPVGAVLNVAPDILSIVARLTGNGEAADELRRQSQEFQQARRKLRQVAQLVFYDERSKPTGSSPSETPGSSVAQPRTEPSATPQVEDAPPRTAEELFASACSSVVRINVRDAKSESICVGSGFFVRDDSTIVTNFHVIEGAHSAEVVLQDGTQFVVSEAESFDEKSDVAILHVVHDKTKTIRPLALAFEVPPVASKAYVIGAPAGLDNSFSEGSVSGHREISDRKWIQTTAPISPGSSGSPVFNERGLVIGMATMSHGLGQNLNFAIASRHIREMLPNGAKRSPLKLTELPSRKQPPKPAVVDLPPGAESDIFEIIRGEAKEAMYLSGDDKKRAMRDILRRLESVPDEEKQKVGYWDVLSYIHFLSNRPQLQMDAAETAVRIDAKDKRGWQSLDWALRTSLPTNWKRVLAARQQIIQLEADDAEAMDFYMLGDAFRELGRFDEALAAFDDALVRDPEHSNSYHGLGQVHQKRKQYFAAVKNYEKAIEFASIDLDSVRGYLELAECYKQVRDFREAIRAYEKALELWPIGQLEHIEEQIRDELPQLRRQARE